MDEVKGFSQQMREHFKKLGKSDEQIATLEGSLANKGQAAREAGLESKEADPAPVAATPTAEPAVTSPAAEVTTYATQTEVAQMFAEVTQALAHVVAQINTMTAEVKALKESDEEKIAKAVASTPRASIWELASQMAVGNADARVNGNSALAKAGPKQAAADDVPQVTPSPLINALRNHAFQGGAQ